MDKYVGKRLDGRYEIRELIGVGGMAYVYKAHDIIDDNIVAVKILKDEYLRNEELSRRFKNESKAIAILSHRNIVRVNDVSFSDTLQYIVMEHIDGITLKEYIDQQKVLKWKEVVHFIVQILQALQHAHDKGIVHQDVKPQNIMLLSDGTIKVTDFGIARFSRVTAQHSEQGDKAIGSVHYISPEQARAEITDEKSDIYSVGVMMYEMLTGKLPFESDNAVSVAIMQMQSIAKRPTEINPGIPEGLEEITLKAMQKNPAKRYQSAAEMLYDIDEFKNNPSIHFEYQYLTNDDDTSHYQTSINRARGIETKRTKEPTPPRVEEADDNDSYEDDDYEVEYRQSRALPVVPILAAFAGIALIIGLIFGMMNFFPDLIGSISSKKNVEVPDVVGKNYNDLKASGELAGFTIVEKNDFGKGPRGIIYDQEPAPGRQVKEGQVLTLYISLGSGKKITIPEVYKISEESALSMLEAAGLTVEVIREHHDEVPAGHVFDITPDIGTEVAEEDEVTLYVSLGVKPAVMSTMPDVAGKKKLNEAISAIEKAGYEVTTIEYINDTLSKDFVVSQTPEGNTECMTDTEVTLLVSAGAAVLQIDAPDVTYNVDYRFFIDDVEDTSLALTNKMSTFEQKPSVSLTVPKTSYTVKVQVSKTGKNRYEDYATFEVTNSETGTDITSEYYNITVMPADYVVPNVVGKEYTDTLITELNVEVIEEYNQSYEAGIIFQQSLVAGTTVEEGDTIELHVSLGVEMIAVPNITAGMGQETAEGMLLTAGFVPSIQYEQSTTVISGCVTRIGILPGTQLPRGSIVTVFISDGTHVSIGDLINGNGGTAGGTTGGEVITPIGGGTQSGVGGVTGDTGEVIVPIT